MNSKKRNIFFVLVIMVGFVIVLTFFISSNQAQDDLWLQGTVDERFHMVSRHLRGFDMAMVETGYRYAELYWAGQDENWEYADYQLDKIRTAVENGLERRPARAASAETFLTMVIPHLEEAIEQRDTTIFWDRFGAFTSSCNACHHNEDVEFIEIMPPKVRYSTVQRPE